MILSAILLNLRYYHEKQSSIEGYKKKYPKNIQRILNDFKQVITKLAPTAQETISYGIPTFDLNGKHLVHFAAFKKHIGFFPTPSSISVFKKELSGYKTSKGTVQFPLDEPVPFDLVKKIVRFRIKEVEEDKG